MEVGQLNKLKVGFIIQARMRSTRLPGKIFLPIPFGNGKPLLKWITDALKQSRFNYKIVVATSSNPENDELEDFCTKEAISIYRGDEENVLSRFLAIVKNDNFDVIVRLTADNPVLDLGLLEKTICLHLENEKDYTKTEGLPLGMNFEIIAPRGLLSLENETLSPEDKEHVTSFIRNHSKHTQTLSMGLHPYESLRLTIDYPNDYAAISFLFSCFEQNTSPDFAGVMKVAQEKSWIFEINRNNLQKKQYASAKEERKDAVAFLKQHDFKWTAQKILELE